MSAYTFTFDWFSNNIPTWDKFIKPFAAKLQGHPINWLEVGTIEGRSAAWALDNVLTSHPQSHITCVSKWQDRSTFKRFKDNMKSHTSKVSIITKPHGTALKLPKLLHQQFDVIYLSSEHHSSHVMEDAVLAFPLLKPGGLMIFNNYTYSKERDNRCPKQAIDAFINAYAEQIKVVTSRWHVIIQKKQHPRSHKPCHGEFWQRT